MARTLYLVAYDIPCNRRRRQLHRYLQTWRVAGQKSVPELWLTPAELQRLRQDLGLLLEPQQDRFQLLALDPRLQPNTIGTAQTHANAPQHFLIV